MNHTTMAYRIASALKFTVFFCFALTFASEVNAQKSKQIEFWKGTIDYNGTELDMGLKVFQMTDGSLTAQFSSYSQGATDIPVEFEKNGDEYLMKLPAARLEYHGTLDQSSGKLVGAIKQGGSENELNFVRADSSKAPTFDRKQTPRAPFPYDVKEVRYKNAKQPAELAGTLTMPQGRGPFPVAITISGSGASDRDASHFGHKPFHIIADHLTRRGIAVLRYDDRGRGDSKGDHAGLTSADLATDVEAGIEFLKKHPRIDTGRIGLIGHSEGGLIAPIVASNRDDVHFIILLAGTGVNGGEILKTQSDAILDADGESDEKLDANWRVHEAILSVIEDNPNATHEDIEAASDDFLNSIDDDETRELMESSARQLVGLLKSNWVNYFVRHDPARTLAKVQCHVLAINGEKDLQVLCDLNLNPIEKALNAGSPASYKVVRFPNMNHVFQETDGSGSPEDYGKIEESFSPKVLATISRWIRRVTR